jgi:hypothetical protein
MVGFAELVSLATPAIQLKRICWLVDGVINKKRKKILYHVTNIKSPARSFITTSLFYSHPSFAHHIFDLVFFCQVSESRSSCENWEFTLTEPKGGNSKRETRQDFVIFELVLDFIGYAISNVGYLLDLDTSFNRFGTIYVEELRLDCAVGS